MSSLFPSINSQIPATFMAIPPRKKYVPLRPTPAAKEAPGQRARLVCGAKFEQLTCRVRSPPLHKCHHCRSIGYQKAEHAQQSRVTKSLGKITTSGRRLKEKLLILLGAHLNSDLTGEAIIRAAAIVQLLMFDVRGHCKYKSVWDRRNHRKEKKKKSEKFSSYLHSKWGPPPDIFHKGN